MKHVISLEHQIILARRNKKLKGQKDRLLDALRDVVESLETADARTPKQENALDKAWKALKLSCDEASH